MFKVSGGFEKQIKLKNEIIKEGYGLKTFSWTFSNASLPVYLKKQLSSLLV